MRQLAALIRAFLFFLAVGIPHLVAAQTGAVAPCDALIYQGDTFRLRGELQRSIQTLNEAYAVAGAGSEKGRAAAALAAAYLQQRRLEEAQPLLREAIASAAPATVRATAANDLGNLLAMQQQAAAAEVAFQQALSLASGNPALELAVELNRLRLPHANQRFERLSAVFARLPELGDERERSRYALNLASEAANLEHAGQLLAYQGFTLARKLSEKIGDQRLLAEAFNGLSQLYEGQQRAAEAMQLVIDGIAAARQVDAGDQLIGLEWRQARLFKAAGNNEAAIAAYRNAVNAIEAVRYAIPVTYQNGRSSFRDTLAPIYLGLADLLLQQAKGLPAGQRGLTLGQARDTVELMKQSEMEDYLGNRCSVGAARLTAKAAIAPGTGVVYPVLLPGRVELLLETSAGIEQAAVTADMTKLEKTAREFLSRVSNMHRLFDSPDELQRAAQELYRLLLSPLEHHFQRQQLKTLVIVPDGFLRRLPFAALHDGQRYMIERFAFAAAPGLSMLNSGDSRKGKVNVLLAGMSEPGDVVEKLTPSLQSAIFQPEVKPEDAASRGLAETSNVRAVRQVAAAGGRPEDGAKRLADMRASLALPGVKKEIDQLSALLGGRPLLDAPYTIARLRQEVIRGDYNYIHLATHGVFGPSAETTYIMAYDDLLTLDRLQDLLRTRTSQSPIALLTLSACQTAEGDDRAPMGLSGAAIQARVGSVLGSLWPVSDDATNLLMNQFYQQLLKQGSKAQALQASQLSLLADKGLMSHPFFWAPFILVGDGQ